ncbi:MAG: sulfotransferase [Gallionellaceae bacterium]|nr:sulfotransferase [Gallionellaceae bacterium]MDD5367077.1 sulfotransferase [Gallionellaceae bacterium]
MAGVLQKSPVGRYEAKLIRRLRWRHLFARLTTSSALPATQPVLIGALGGSGTRALVNIFRQAGIWMGDWTDPKTEDALAMRAFLAAWFEPIFTALDRGDKVPARAGQEFLAAMRVHRMHVPDSGQAWGWKNPRNMWLIPFYAGFFPGLKFIHIVRDGRDMALSDNQFLLNSHGDALLGGDWRQNPLRAQLAMWEKGNSYAKLSAERFLAKDHYLPIRYEDLCLDPLATIERMLEFIEAPDAKRLADEFAGLIVPSKRIGAWKIAPEPEVHDLEPGVMAALRTFGYPAS